MRRSLCCNGPCRARASFPVTLEASTARHKVGESRTAAFSFRRDAGDPNGVAPDAVLVGKAQGGSHQAFIELVERYSSLVHSIAFEITGSLLQSDEVAQEVFLYSWARLSELRSPSRFRSWICQMAR